MDDPKAQARGFSSTPDRPSRLNAFASGARCSPTDLVSWIESAQLEFIHRVLTRSGQDSIWTRLHTGAYHDSAAADLDYLRRHF
jgi:hypothetical protein